MPLLVEQKDYSSSYEDESIPNMGGCDYTSSSDDKRLLDIKNKKYDSNKNVSLPQLVEWDCSRDSNNQIGFGDEDWFNYDDIWSTSENEHVNFLSKVLYKI